MKKLKTETEQSAVSGCDTSACYASGDCVKITESVAFIGKVGTLVKRIGGKMWHVNIEEMPLKFRETEFQKHNNYQRSHAESK
jgi:hypothetical protein